jgi:trans-aconitate 2-methyltransferase
MTWDPAQHLKFAQPRLRPAPELLARVPLERPQRVYDLGCGAGNVTRLLLERWPAAATTGIDNSAARASGARAARRRMAARQPGHVARAVRDTAARLGGG